MRATLFLAPLAVAAGVLATPTSYAGSRFNPQYPGEPIYYFSEGVRRALREAAISQQDAQELALAAKLVFSNECTTQAQGAVPYWKSTANWASSSAADAGCQVGNMQILNQVLDHLNGWELKKAIKN